LFEPRIPAPWFIPRIKRCPKCSLLEQLNLMARNYWLYT
jgi:hypothetical protein